MSGGWTELRPDLGRQIVEEYARFKKAIVDNEKHTERAGHNVVVKETFELPHRLQDGLLVREKIRGGTINWDTDPNHPVSWVDEDPETLDRISVEQVLEKDGQVRRHSGLIYREFSEPTHPASKLMRLVVEKTEDFVAATPEGETLGTVVVKVDPETFQIVDEIHY